MKETYQQVWAQLEKHGQQHLLGYFSDLSDGEKERLLNQLTKIDFDKMSKLYTDTVRQPTNIIHSLNDVSPIPVTNYNELTDAQKQELAAIGMKTIKQGKVAALVVAGGQGTRLGHNGPKGTLDIGLPSHKSLFQLQAERLMNLSRRAGLFIPWYIMTSHENHADTVSFFEASGYFGYPFEDVTFFQQGSLPSVDQSGRLLLSSKSSVCSSPGGNGDCFAALARSGALQDMKSRGVEWLFYCNVDNALIRVADPLFVGFSVKASLPVASKVVNMLTPREKIGLLCKVHNRPYVIEYSDMSSEVLRLLEQEEQFRIGNISIHLFHLDFVEQICKIDLPFHAAFKRVPHVNESGQLTSPDQPNACKFEQFFFDCFPYSDDMAVLKVNRQEEFAPIKNRDGDDSPNSARTLILRLHKHWLLDAGVSGELIKADIEISPLTSYSGEGLDVSVAVLALQAEAKIL